MKVFKMLMADLKIGFHRKIRFILFVCLCFLCCSIFINVVSGYGEISGRSTYSMADCMAFIWQGTYPLIREESMETFNLPPMWLMLIMVCLLMPLDYPIRSMELWGSQYLIRTNRQIWWCSKCLYTLIVDLFTFSIYITVMVVFCLINRMPLSFVNHAGLYERLFSAVELNFSSPLNSFQNGMLLIFLPVCGICTLSMIQLFISVFLHPVIAYLVSAVQLVWAVYDNRPWLPANATMAIRSVLIDRKGVAVSDSIFWCCGLCAAVILLGILLIRKKEIIGLKKEEA